MSRSIDACLSKEYEIEKAWDSYGKKLLKVSGVGYRRPGYSKLMTQLHDTVFIFSIPMDRNRELDGLYLRNGLWDVDDRPCSVLEMLVGLSQRMNGFLGWNGNDQSGKLFWEMLRNLELDRFDDTHYSERNVSLILNRWMGRRFEPDGSGGIFPILKTDRDQREIEFWSQMNEYLMKYYPNG